MNTRSMPAMFAAISVSLRSLRASSLPEGSPTLVVPPPISTIGRWPGLLQLAQHHDADEIADMQRRRGAVEADIAGQPLAAREPVQPRLVGRLMDIAAGLQARAGSPI